MYSVNDLLNVVEKYIKNDKEELAKRKNNISNNYILAKNDIKAIENFEDSKKVCENIEKQLNDLQQRIVNRNRGNI